MTEPDSGARAADVSPRIGLALSGGGFRASLFHVGVIRAFADAGKLRFVRRITALSGGSVVAAQVALNWEACISGHMDEVEAQVRRLAMSNVRDRVVIRVPFHVAWNAVVSLLPSRIAETARLSRVRLLGRLLDKSLYHGATLQTLRRQTEDAGAPEIDLIATDLGSGASFSFCTGGVAYVDVNNEHRHVVTEIPTVAEAVAASMAFPVLFPPEEVSLRRLGIPVDAGRRSSVLLTDGGVYDNLAVRGMRDRLAGDAIDIVFVSDASEPFHWTGGNRHAFFVRRMIRIIDLIMARIGKLEREASSSALKSNDLKGVAPHIAFIACDSEFEPDGATGPVLHVNIQRALPDIRTDLNRFNDLEAELLIAQGYSVARESLLRMFDDLSLGRFALNDRVASFSDPDPNELSRLAERLKRGQRRSFPCLPARDPISVLYAIVIVALMSLAVAWAQKPILRMFENDSEFARRNAQAQATKVAHEIVSRIAAAPNNEEYVKICPEGVDEPAPQTWNSSQACYALLCWDGLDAGTRSLVVRVLESRFQSAERIPSGRGWVGESKRDGEFYEFAPSGLWTVAALARAARTAEPQERTTLEPLLAEAQAATAKYRDHLSGGWCLFGRQRNTTTTNQYATTLALLAMLECHTGGYGWKDVASSRDLEVTIQNTVSWFLGDLHYQDQRPRGWTGYLEADKITRYTSDGLSLQITCELLAAQRDFRGYQFSEEVESYFQKLIDRSSNWPIDSSIPVSEILVRECVVEDQTTPPEVGVVCLWHPWALAACSESCSIAGDDPEMTSMRSNGPARLRRLLDLTEIVIDQDLRRRVTFELSELLIGLTRASSVGH